MDTTGYSCHFCEDEGLSPEALGLQFPPEVEAAIQVALREAEGETELLGEADPVSPKCEGVLEKSPSCWDFRGIRQWVMCQAWNLMDKEKLDFAVAIRRSWDEAKRVCVR